MGPRAFARGDQIIYVTGEVLFVASMGPRAFARGDQRRFCELFRNFRWLQWGRELSPAEISVISGAVIGGRSLQWGRELSPAEIA